jgi:transposase
MCLKEPIDPIFSPAEPRLELFNTCHHDQLNIPNYILPSLQPSELDYLNLNSLENIIHIMDINLDQEFNSHQITSLISLFLSSIDQQNQFYQPLEHLLKFFMHKFESFEQEKSALQDQNEALTNELEELKTKQKQNSTTSNYGSSHDTLENMPDPDLEKLGSSESKESERHQGAQPGHPRHLRQGIPLEEADNIINHDLTEEEKICPHCGGSLVRDEDKDKKYDFYNLPEITVTKIVNIVFAYRCEKCGKSHFKAHKNLVDACLVSNTLLALMSVLKSNFHQSIRKTQEFLRDIFHIKVCNGYVNKCMKRVSSALRPIFLEIIDNIKLVKKLNIDETGHRFSGSRVYTWVMVSDDLILFKIGTRSSYLLDVILGSEFEGVIGSDCFKAYFKFVKSCKSVTLQICLAHLIREFRFCTTFPDVDVIEYGKKNLLHLTELFNIYHERRLIEDRESVTYKELTGKLHEIKDKILESSTIPPKKCRKAKALADRMKEIGLNYFTFIDNPDVEPTNNISERMLRGVVIDRKITIGTESFAGNAYCETLWTIIATLKNTTMDPYRFIVEVLDAYEAGQPLPSLVNPGGFIDSKYILMAKQELQAIHKADKKRTAEKKAIKDANNAKKANQKGSKALDQTDLGTKKRKAAKRQSSPLSYPPAQNTADSVDPHQPLDLDYSSTEASSSQALQLYHLRLSQMVLAKRYLLVLKNLPAKRK